MDNVKLAPEHFDIDDAGNLTLCNDHLVTAAENACESFLPEEGGISISITIKF